MRKNMSRNTNETLVRKCFFSSLPLSPLQGLTHVQPYKGDDTGAETQPFRLICIYGCPCTNQTKKNVVNSKIYYLPSTDDNGSSQKGNNHIILYVPMLLSLSLFPFCLCYKMDGIIFTVTANQMTYAYFDYIFISDKWDRLLILPSKQRKKYKFHKNRIARTRSSQFHRIGVEFGGVLIHLSGEIESLPKRMKKSNLALLSCSLFMICLVYIKTESSIQSRFYALSTDFCFPSLFSASSSFSTNRCCPVGW